MVEIDNNWAENALRGITLGRKNWIPIGRERSGPKIAALLSVLETCKRLNRVGRQGWFAATTTPCPHLPLIEPDGRISRIRLSEAVRRFAS